jgi:chitin disaccharide deacetylase
LNKTPNPILKKLGYSKDDRVVIIHADDIGMCQSTISAIAELDAAGVVTSSAVMVPCPWFLSAAAYARNHPEIDLGIHLTINSEWKTYRWGPISTTDPRSGLIDNEGYFYHKFEEAQEHGCPQAVGLELKAQIQRALAAGIHPTHVDSHMFTLLHPKFIEIYLQTAYRFGLPAMMPRRTVKHWQHRGSSFETAEKTVNMVHEFEEQGYPMLDCSIGLKLDDFENRLEQTKRALSDLPVGLSHFYFHPCKDTHEIRAITTDWQGRVADHRVFLDKNLQKHIQNIGIQIIGYRPLLQVMPSAYKS